jgi:hypothetical protein
MSEDAERIAVLHRTLAAALDIKKHNKLSAFVPYAKQQEFFELGATRGRGCSTPATSLGNRTPGRMKPLATSQEYIRHGGQD